MLFLLISCSQVEEGTDTAVHADERVLELSKSQAYAKYVSAVNAVVNSGSIAGNILLRGEFSMMDMTRENNVIIGIKHVFGEGDNFQGEIDASWTDAGFFSWYKDGTFYFYDFDGGFKFDMPGYVYKRMMLTMLVTQVLFPEEGIFYLDVIEDTYGTAIRFDVTQSVMQNVLRELANFEDTGGVIAFGEDEVSYDFFDAVIRVRINHEGQLEQIRVAFHYIMTHHHISDYAVSAAYLEVGMILSQIGDVTIDFPDVMYDFPHRDDPWS